MKMLKAYFMNLLAKHRHVDTYMNANMLNSGFYRDIIDENDNTIGISDKLDAEKT